MISPGDRHLLFSIVIPSFNQGEFLERTLLSITTQGKPVEIIVIDGGSTDATLEVLRRYAGSIAYWESQKDRGQSHALNKGFARATGDVFGWMNADDTYAPGAFDAAERTFASRPEALLVFGDYSEIDADDRLIAVHPAFDYSEKHFVYEGFHLNSQAMFWRARLHQAFGEFDESLHRTMDYDFIARIGRVAGRRGLVRIPHVLASFRRHEKQKTQAFDEVVDREHRYIAQKLGTGRYRPYAPAVRLAYRVRRLWWYLRRRGVRFALQRMAGRP